jgi:hypothetical protein
VVNIFARGDPLKKANEADIVIKEENEEYDDEEEDPRAGQAVLPTDEDQHSDKYVNTNLGDPKLHDTTPLHEGQDIHMNFTESGAGNGQNLTKNLMISSRSTVKKHILKP